MGNDRNILIYCGYHNGCMFSFGISNLRISDAGSSVGIVTNASGVTLGLERNVDYLSRKGLKIARIFTPEHGYYGTRLDGEAIEDSTINGIPTVSLYGKKSLVEKQDVAGLDSIIFDIQDAGARFYTYTSTLFDLLRVAAGLSIKVIVLDRPNPIAGDMVQGPVMKQEYASFVGRDEIPTRYGLTIGELAGFFNRKFHSELEVVRMEWYNRGKYYDQLVPWYIPLSLHLPTLESVINYSAFCLLEGTNISVGRGTPSPFSQFGAPFFDDARFKVPGAILRKTVFTPSYSQYRDVTIPGFYIHIVDRKLYNPLKLVLQIFAYFRKKREFEWINNNHIDQLYGSDSLRKMIDSGASPDDIISELQPNLEQFLDRRGEYLIYR